MGVTFFWINGCNRYIKQFFNIINYSINSGEQRLQIVFFSCNFILLLSNGIMYYRKRSIKMNWQDTQIIISKNETCSIFDSFNWRGKASHRVSVSKCNGKIIIELQIRSHQVPHSSSLTHITRSFSRTINRKRHRLISSQYRLVKTFWISATVRTFCVNDLFRSNHQATPKKFYCPPIIQCNVWFYMISICRRLFLDFSWLISIQWSLGLRDRTNMSCVFNYIFKFRYDWCMMCGIERKSACHSLVYFKKWK